jgi:putative ATP-dependent endonuclease of the OLD family
MQISRLIIKNFRGIKSAEIFLKKHSVLLGDNNTGKTSTFEAIDLVLGPDRLNRFPPIDEHDFFQGKYLASHLINHNAQEAEAEAEENPEIFIEVVVTDLSLEQKSHFNDFIEFWDTVDNKIYDEPNPAGVDEDHIVEALRLCFIGRYEKEEDDFEGKTYFSKSYEVDENPAAFGKVDKRLCGFLYLRSLRTASRAVSLERGSLLDIILRLKELRPQMWENTISTLAQFDVASEPQLGITGILENINDALKQYVPKEWGVQPHLKVSNLTRDHLRKIVTAFIATGDGDHAAPFYRQGTGTINMLVLAMLSIIAKEKQNVIFAMEEPETAIPPYAQKRIVHEVLKLSSQSLFTSHSPYVLEEFNINNIVVLNRNETSTLSQHIIKLPKSVKLKRFHQEFRTRFCEGLLSRRILLAEGATEADSLTAVFRRLEEIDPTKYSSLESLGICTIDAGTDSQIKDLAVLYSSLGKEVYAFCDKQDDASKDGIEAVVNNLFMHDEKGFEDLVLKNTTEVAMKRFAEDLDWPDKVIQRYPEPEKEIFKALRLYFKGKKAEKVAAEFLVQCEEDEIPEWLRNACADIKGIFEPLKGDEEDELAIAEL